MTRKNAAPPTEASYRTDYAPDEVLDEAEEDPTVPPVRYEISSYGIDFDVKGLVNRLRDAKVLVPEFQRSFVWTMPDSSRFIESLLLGLPVPGIFLAKESDSQKLFVIDGQQRLKSLLYFYEGVFNPDPSRKSQRVFKLTNVQRPYEGKAYQDLDERSRQVLDDSVLHATVVKQDSPRDDDTSIYHVYERLNSGGRRLHPQEIRTAIFHGPLIDAIKDVNRHPSWRQLFGKKSARLKDEEMILRFLALYTTRSTYERPMEEFLSKFSKKNRRLQASQLLESLELFRGSTDAILELLGAKAFRPGRNFNAAVFDSITFGMAKLIASGRKKSKTSIQRAFRKLMNSRTYQETTSRSTADKAFVEARLKAAERAFLR
jgi:uncharacterized protein with ParB-like and HNH nuclease domain